MGEKLKRLLWQLADNWDVATIIAVTIPLLILDILPANIAGSIDLSVKHYLGLILVALIGIALSQLRANPGSLHKEFTRSQQKLNDIFLLTKGKISAVRPDKEVGIWEGFQGNYYAINAPWLLERRSVEKEDAMVDKHVARYLNPKFNRAIYVFFTQGEERCHFPEAIKRFSEFAQKLLQKSPEAAEKIEVVVAEESAPGFTLFVGSKEVHGEEGQVLSYAILYINEKPLMSKTGLPKWAMVTVNEDLNTSLEDYAKDLVNDYETMSLEEFFVYAEQGSFKLRVADAPV